MDMPRSFIHPAAKDISLDALLHALSDPERRKIVGNLLKNDGMRCNKACSDLPPSTISFHYKVLRDAGLIHSEKKGIEVINTLRFEEVEKRFPGLLAAIIDHCKTTRKTREK